MSNGDVADLSVYCKAYHVRDLRRCSDFHDDLVLDRDGAPLQDDDVVFIHPDYSVTRSIFIQETATWQPPAAWVEYCAGALSFHVPEELAAESPSAAGRSVCDG